MRMNVKWEDFLADYKEKSEDYHRVVPIWQPESIQNKNSTEFIQKLGFHTWGDFQTWSYNHPSGFWEAISKKLNIQWHQIYSSPYHRDSLPDNDIWFKDGTLNILETIFENTSNQTALLYSTETSNHVENISYASLQVSIKKYAALLSHLQLKPDDRILFCSPFSIDLILLYFSCIYIGAIPVLLADSFSAIEIEERRKLVNANWIISTPSYTYNNKTISLSEKITQTLSPNIIWVDAISIPSSKSKNYNWNIIKENNINPITPFYFESKRPITLLFSSGTTKTPKIIPWNSLTPLKCASDGFLLHDIHPKDIITWTTGMGWMMAPWLLFAGLLNHATVSVYQGAPTTTKYLNFIDQNHITILGTIPSVAKQWLNFDKSYFKNWNVRLFSSTGEPSNIEDYLKLTWLTNGKAPMIEYCGGTEIGGAYISSTLELPIALCSFNTAAPGLHFELIKDSEGDTANSGSVYIQTPSIGLSQELLNYSHAEEYYDHPYKDISGRPLRKHGDAFENQIIDNHNYFKSLGRSDDSMNLGGIKISSIEIESVIKENIDIQDIAAVGIAPITGGPEELYIVCQLAQPKNASELTQKLQSIIREKLNPLFKIKQVLIWDSLPRTASQKLQRKVIKKKIQESLK
ncbi:MAG: AMP-binding protein [Cytophagaceae bacterium]